MLNLIHKYQKRSAYICVLWILILVAPSCNADSNKDNSSSNSVQGKKIEIFNPHDEYLEEDKLLNKSYKSLLKSLDKNNAILLKQAQLKWIKWRDRTCILAQTKVNLKLGSLGHSVRDDCFISLTERRSNELQQFVKEPRDASRKKYDFSRENDYVDLESNK